MYGYIQQYIQHIFNKLKTNKNTKKITYSDDHIIAKSGGGDQGVSSGAKGVGGGRDKLDIKGFVPYTPLIYTKKKQKNTLVKNIFR